MTLSAPQPLTAACRLDDFDCGEPSLDAWLRQRALVNQVGGASRTFVIVDQADAVFGYYALSAGAVAHALVASHFRRNMPDPLPVILLGRLAVDKRMQGTGLGGDLMVDAVQRVRGIAEHAGVRAVLVHALHDEAVRFYRYFGFQPTPLNPLTLMLPVY